MQKGKVLNFGEILLRICPDMSEDWVSRNQLPFYVGGAELNVATALALWDVPSAYVSAMPDNSICQSILEYLNNKQVDTSKMLLTGERLGLYYLPKGKDLKNAGVIYDRANSSYADLKRTDLDWDQLLDGVSWFHFSAICPAINQEVADICLDAVQAAKRKGIFVSLDLNFRSKLWKYGKSPLEVMPALAAYCDLIMGNIWAAHQMLGTQLAEQFKEVKPTYPKDELLAQAVETSKELIERFENCKYVANTFRFDYKEKGIQYFTSLFEQDALTISNEYLSENILDKVGSGDCFMAGLIYGLYRGKSNQDTLDFATAAAYDKLYIASDATTSTVNDIEKRIIR